MPLELHITVVAGRQGSVAAGHIHHGDGAVVGQPHAPFGAGQYALEFSRRCHKRLRVLHGDTVSPTNGNSFELFGAHHRTDPGTAGSAMQIVDDAGVAATGLPRRADGGNTDQRVSVRLFDSWLGVPDGLAPEIIRRQQFGFVILDVQVYRRSCASFENQQIPACHFQLTTELAARI